MKRFEITVKFYSFKALLKMAGAFPTLPPGSAAVHPFNLQIPPKGAKWLGLRTTGLTPCERI